MAFNIDKEKSLETRGSRGPSKKTLVLYKIFQFSDWQVSVQKGAHNSMSARSCPFC